MEKETQCPPSPRHSSCGEQRGQRAQRPLRSCLCLCEPGRKVEPVPVSEYEFSRRGTKGQGPQTTSTRSPCSLSPPPPLCATLRATTQNQNSRRPIFLGFPLCLCASVVILILFSIPLPARAGRHGPNYDKLRIILGGAI